MKNWKTILVILIIGALVAASAVYYVYNKPHRDIAREEAKYQLSASALYSEYEADETAANAKYLDQVVEVSGTVEDITSNEAGKPTLILTADDALIGGVSATMSEAGDVPVAAGDAVTLKCRCTGMLMDVVLVECSLLE